MSHTAYDDGWDAFYLGRPYNRHASSDWRTGWKEHEQMNNLTHSLNEAFLAVAEERK